MIEDLKIDNTTWKIGFTSGHELSIASKDENDKHTRSASLNSSGFLEFSLSASNENDTATLVEYDNCDFMLVIPVTDDNTLHIDCLRGSIENNQIMLKSNNIDFTSIKGFSENGEFNAYPALKLSQDGDLVSFDLINGGENPLKFKVTAEQKIETLANVVDDGVSVEEILPASAADDAVSVEEILPASAADDAVSVEEILPNVVVDVEEISRVEDSVTSTTKPVDDDNLSEYSSVKNDDTIIGSAKAAFLKPGKIRLSVCLSEDSLLDKNNNTVSKLLIHTNNEETIIVKASILENESNFKTGAISILTDKISNDILAKFKGKVLSVSCKLRDGLKVDRSPLFIPTGALSTKSVNFSTSSSSYAPPPAVVTVSSHVSTVSSTPSIHNSSVNRSVSSNSSSRSNGLRLAVMLAFIFIVLIATFAIFYQQ